MKHLALSLITLILMFIFAMHIEDDNKKCVIRRQQFEITYDENTGLDVKDTESPLEVELI